MSVYRAESCQIVNTDDLARDWHALQQIADCSYFQSWGWIGTWLEQIAADLNPVVIKVWHEDRLVGMGLFVAGHVHRHGVIHASVMFLNEYPLQGKNMVIEQNGLLAARGHERAVNEETARYLLNEFKQHDEFMFGAIAESNDFDSMLRLRLNQAKFFINESSVSRYVDLAGIPGDIDGYLATMSKNRRAQIRRSLQLYENHGPLQIDEARNIEEALVLFDGLKTLHTQSWLDRGRPGSFANATWERFHKALIKNRFATGEIQLLKIRAASVELGYLYNFVWRDHVYVLQTGFSVSPDKRLMPGYVAHVLAIMHNKARGMVVYDLMHGDSLYKKMLCNRRQKLFWAVLQRRRLKFMVERLAVGLVRGFRQLTRLRN